MSGVYERGCNYCDKNMSVKHRNRLEDGSKNTTVAKYVLDHITIITFKIKTVKRRFDSKQYEHLIII